MNALVDSGIRDVIPPSICLWTGDIGLGNICANWRPPLEELRRIVAEYEEAVKASKEGRYEGTTQEVSRPPEQGAALESRTPLDCGTA